ncbi:hypothetical protein ACFE04_016690 [Oxalis oulophora]
MADKASRGLVLYGDGLARSIEASHTHLHSLASKASCGFLTLPTNPKSGKIAEIEDERIVREFAVLLDAYDTYLHFNEEAGKKEPLRQTISDRFMGMKAALVTNNSSLKSFGDKLGLTVLQLSDFSNDNVASELLKLLGFEQGKTLDASQYDLVFVHIGAGENLCDEKNTRFANDTECLNSLVGDTLQISQPESEIGSRLHLSLVMSYGSISESDDPKFSVLSSRDEKSSNLKMIYPRQTYTVKGEANRDNVRIPSSSLLMENGGNLVIPADRFLHEVAFKLWKAPKYGA